MRQRYGAGDRARAAVRPAPPGRPRPDARRLSAPRPADHADRVRRHRLRSADAPTAHADLGLHRGRATPTSSPRMYERPARDGRSTPRSSAASATRSSPTRSRRPTACCTPTARRRSRSSRSPRVHDGVAHAHPRAASDASDAFARADQARRPRADAVRARAARRGRRARRARSPSRSRASAHLRWHPLRGEWVTYAALPPGPHLPAAAGVQPAGADDRPGAARPSCRPATGTWRCSTTASRRSAARRPRRAAGAARADARRPTATARWSSSRQDAAASLGALPLDHIELLLAGLGRPHARGSARAATSRYVLPVREPRRRGRRDAAPSARPDLRLPGGAAGAGADAEQARASTTQRTAAACSRTLIEAELRRRRAHALRGRARGRLRSGLRALSRTRCWVAPIRAGGAASAISTTPQRADLARALKTVLLKYDGLWQRPLPYLMAWYQAPTDGERASRGAPARRVLSAVPHAATG